VDRAVRFITFKPLISLNHALATWEVDLLSGEAECRELLEVCPHSEHIFPGSAGEIQLEQGGTALCRCALEDCGLDGGRKGILVSAMKRMPDGGVRGKVIAVSIVHFRRQLKSM
jgi:hypothetical protein